MNNETIRERKRFAKKIQMETIKMIASLGIGHIGGALSIADVLAVLYGGQLKHDPQNPKWEERDWLVCSKGHAGPGVYAALGLRGYFPLEQLDTLNRPHTILPSHCDRNLTPGIDMTTGSLGQGASSAAGIAMGHKINKTDNRVFLILGDGELQEGQVWEMALFAAQKKLSNLIAFVDNNHQQIDGPTDEVNSLGDVAAKFSEFGWFAQDVNGHDPAAIDAAIVEAKKQNERPSMIVLDTIKGNGWSEIAGTTGSHNRAISSEDKDVALFELQQAYEAI
jgi:transketolase